MSRQRFVRDYSTDGMLAPPSRVRASPSQERFTSPQRHGTKHAMDRPTSPEEVQDLRKLDFNLQSYDDRGSYEPSVSTQHTSVSNSSSKLADFFGPEVFQIVLHNPTTAHQLKKFAQSRLCGENLEFLEKVSEQPASVPFRGARLTLLRSISISTPLIKSQRPSSTYIATSSPPVHRIRSTYPTMSPSRSTGTSSIF